MKPLALALLLLLTLPALAQERQPRTDARERTPAELSVISWNQNRRIEKLERLLEESQERERRRELEWAAMQVYVSMVFWVTNVLGGGLLATLGGFLIKRVWKKDGIDGN